MAKLTTTGRNRKVFQIHWNRYRNTKYKRLVIAPLSASHAGDTIGVKVSASYRAEEDVYTNNEERIPGWIMQNGQLVPRNSKDK